MYTIYVDGDLIYSPTLIDDGYYVTNPKINSELNLISTLEFGLPVGAVGYNSINKMKSIITVYDDDTLIFRGRCLSDELNIDNQKDVYCESELGFLKDSVVSWYSYVSEPFQDYLAWILNSHNAQVDESRKIYLGNVGYDYDVDYVSAYSNDYPSTFDEIQTQLIQKFGGYISLRRGLNDQNVEVTYLDYNPISGGQNPQVIEFGSNIIDFSQKIDAQEIFTVLIPLGKEVSESQGLGVRLDITRVNDGKNYLEDANGIATYGRIYKSIIWDSIDSDITLWSYGMRALAAGANVIPQIELTVVDMHMLDVDASAIKLGEYNRIVSDLHGIDTWLPCVRQSIDLENPEQSLYSFGTVPTTLTENL